MIRIVFVVAAVALFCVCLFAGSGVAGTWEVVAVPDGGNEINWKLVIQEDGEKLSGTLSGEMGDFQIEDVKFSDGTLTFKVTVDDQVYTTESKISGSKLDGMFKGGGGQGTLKGAKHS